MSRLNDAALFMRMAALNNLPARALKPTRLCPEALPFFPPDAAVSYFSFLHFMHSYWNNWKTDCYYRYLICQHFLLHRSFNLRPFNSRVVPHLDVQGSALSPIIP